MTKIAIPTATTPARRACVGCELVALPAQAGAPLCAHCAELLPAAILARIAGRAQAATNILYAASRRYQEALAALPPAERKRWHHYDRTRKRKADGEALSAVLLARLASATAAMRGEGVTNDPMDTPGLRALLAADEAWYWAGQEHAAYSKRAEDQTATLTAWLEAQAPRAA